MCFVLNEIQRYFYCTVTHFIVSVTVTVRLSVTVSVTLSL